MVLRFFKPAELACDPGEVPSCIPLYIAVACDPGREPPLMSAESSRLPLVRSWDQIDPFVANPRSGLSGLTPYWVAPVMSGSLTREAGH